MMRLKLVGANRASFYGLGRILEKGVDDECEVEDTLGEHLLKQTQADALGNVHPIWRLLESTDGDSAVELSDPEEEEVEEDEEPVEEPVAKKPAPRKKTATRKKTAAKKTASRRTRKAAA